MKPEGILLKFSCVAKDVSYFDLTGGTLSRPRDEWKIYLVDKNGDTFSRFAPDDTGRIYRWTRLSQNRKGRPPVEVANDFFEKVTVNRHAIQILEDNR